jgi:hypothetical protein
MSTSRNRSFDVAVSFSSAVTGLRAADFTVVWSESSLFTTALTAVSTTHFILSVSIDASRGVRRGEMTISMSESSGNVSPRNAAAQDSIIIAYGECGAPTAVVSWQRHRRNHAARFVCDRATAAGA